MRAWERLTSKESCGTSARKGVSAIMTPGFWRGLGCDGVSGILELLIVEGPVGEIDLHLEAAGQSQTSDGRRDEHETVGILRDEHGLADDFSYMGRRPSALPRSAQGLSIT